ncbi:MAG TPA: P-loop NTPase [Acidimicrobiales bacterium]|nr:P-loop NTPase [Acidimicrobiales bacterium]
MSAAPDPSGDARFPVAVVEPTNRARGRILRLLRDALDVDAFPSIDAVQQEIDLNTPWILVFGPSYADDAGLKEVQRLAHAYPLAGTVLIAEDLSTDVLQLALRAHIGDVLSALADANELLEAIARVADSLGGTPLASTGAQRDGLGRLITVVSTKGGAGKSVVASNVGVLLAQATGGSAALVDADLQFGDAAIMLNVSPERTIVDVMAVIRRLDPDMLRDLLLRHDPSGLLVLPAPVEPAFADQVGAADLVRIVNTLRAFCHYVVVDTSPQLTDVVLALLEESDDILLVCPPEVPSVKNARLALQTLRLLNIPLSKVRLVLNRSTTKGKVDTREVEKALQLKAEVEVPVDPAVLQAVNEGLPVVLAAPRSAAAKGYRKLAQLVAASESRV